jgi:putative acetyltransferase
MNIKIDDLQGPEIAALLQEHLDNMYALSPPESVFALDLNRLRQPDITFWSAWEGRELAGCGALKQLDAQHAEVKSMRTAKAHLRKGVASQILAHIIEVAQQRGYKRLSLETGTVSAFEPAQRLYSSYGFKPCGPFADYKVDVNSLFMSKELLA